MKRILFYTIALGFLASACHSNAPKEQPKEYFEKPHNKDTQDVNRIMPNEKHFTFVKQLTFGGNNAEAYFSFNDKGFSFQSDNGAWGLKCDQIFYFPLADGDMKSKKPQLISTGAGRTTCAYFLPGDTEILFASTHKTDVECPKVPERTDHKYVWPVYNSYDIYVADLKGHIKRQLTNSPGYDAEATVSPQGDKIVFTSTRSGDLELWTMNMDGTHLKQVTHELGYDGGACFSPDGKKLVFRASRPKTPDEVKEYKDLLKNGQVMPIKLEIFTCNVDGSDLKQITHLGKANWAPCYHPNGKKIIFSSNSEGTKGFNFNLYMINPDGSNLEKITNDSVFAAFPMFSRDGKHLIFSSNRHNNGTHDTNLFLADWKD
jgi:dipeptidyl aminopeptidase/acylaminoacyl peptidase